MSSDPPPYIMDSTLPPVYSLNVISEIEASFDQLIMGETHFPPLQSCYKIDRLIQQKDRYENNIKPLSATRNAFRGLFSPRSDGYPPYQLLRIWGLVTLPAAIIGDMVKPPYYLAQIAVASSRSKRARKEVENQIINEAVASLHLGQQAVYEIVMRLNIETHEAWNQQIQDHGPYLSLTLARLLEAYGSRFAPPGTVYLASRKKLCREYCSGIASLHFDQIHKLKVDLISVEFLQVDGVTDPSAAITRWLPRVWKALKGPWVDEIESRSFYHILQRLHST
ncbi:hypothetical protein BJ875DRAFT_489637 [Amylocarpus encephaloides]|uniref:Uncharacterized protein n=1 Tax=Amylocarpus encephaloides TaxID=45428 RepID=A0A9P7Y8E6_9HELO|nr:hypothetical protein BJ875DRAFT_489637 [Amylocarpus encephaloides]